MVQHNSKPSEVNNLNQVQACRGPRSESIPQDSNRIPFGLCSSLAAENRTNDLIED
jgi:hypothetical protein